MIFSFYEKIFILVFVFLPAVSCRVIFLRWQRFGGGDFWGNDRGAYMDFDGGWCPDDYRGRTYARL